jgi:hypothetical protein
MPWRMHHSHIVCSLCLTPVPRAQTCLDELRDLSNRADVTLTSVPYFDVEVRSVYGLRALSAALFDETRA